MLYPYLSDEEIKLVFEKDMLNDSSLESVFLEVNFALQEALRNKNTYPYLLQLYKDKYCGMMIDKNIVVKYWNSENSIPEEYLKKFGDHNEGQNI